MYNGVRELAHLYFKSIKFVTQQLKQPRLSKSDVDEYDRGKSKLCSTHKMQRQAENNEWVIRVYSYTYFVSYLWVNKNRALTCSELRHSLSVPRISLLTSKVFSLFDSLSNALAQQQLGHGALCCVTPY